MNRLIILFLLLCTIASCNNQPVLSQVANSRMKLILKGTYETNSSHPWREIYQNDYWSSQPPEINQPVSIDDFRFYFDFADMGLSTLDQQTSDTTVSDWSFFFQNNRTLLCPTQLANDGTALRTCESTNGLTKLNDFFEDGLRLDNTDVAEGSYRSLFLDLRKMITAPGTNYSNANEPGLILSIFDNKNIEGVSLSDKYAYALGDNSNEQDARTVPFINRNLELNIDRSERPYVLEVRLFLKNLMMNHLRVDNTLNPRLLQFVGPSDWLENHAYDDNNAPNGQGPQNHSRLGGAILFTGRIYFTDNIASLNITRNGPVCPGGVGSNTGLSYFAVLPAESVFSIRELPLGATKYESAQESITNLPSSAYDLYITHDRLMNTSSGVSEGKDGFPESFRLCRSGIELTPSSTVNVDLTSCMCP